MWFLSEGDRAPSKAKGDEVPVLGAAAVRRGRVVDTVGPGNGVRGAPWKDSTGEIEPMVAIRERKRKQTQQCSEVGLGEKSQRCFENETIKTAAFPNSIPCPPPQLQNTLAPMAAWRGFSTAVGGARGAMWE